MSPPSAIRHAWPLLLVACWMPREVAPVEEGLSLPKGSYAASELYQPVSVIRSADGSGRARGHSNVAMIKGYLLVPYSVDGGKLGGGLSVYDLSDPRSPTLVKQVDEPILREAHGFGLSSSYGGEHAAFQTTEGIEFWDLTQPTHRS